MSSWGNFQRTKFFRLVLIVLALGLLVWWNPLRFFGPAQAVLGTVALPFQKGVAFLGYKFSGVTDLVGSIGELKRENERLTEESVRLQAEQAQFTEVRKENDVLRTEIGLLPREKYTLQAATVIGQDQQDFGNWMLIDKGAKQGLRQGMPVIVGGGVLVGRVEEALPYSARVLLLTSSESLINGIDNQSEAPGIIRGQYGLGVVMDMVLQTDALNTGDEIVTSGLGGEIPRGLLIGKIQEVRPSSDRLFQQAIVAPAAQYTKLRVVFVMTHF